MRAARVMVTLLLGEGAALGDGGDVGTVDGDDAVEDVAGFGDVVAVGDDADHVLVAAAGDGDVEAAAGRRRRGQADAGGDVAGLPAVLGRHVAEPDMLTGVVGGEGHVAVSALVGHGQRSVVADAGDGPGVSVADGLAGCGDEPPVVATCRHDVTDVGVLAAGDPCRRVGVEVAGVEAGLLDGAVDGVDVVVGRRHQGPVRAVGGW